MAMKYFPVLLADGSCGVILAQSPTSVSFWFMVDGVNFTERHEGDSWQQDGRKTGATTSVVKVGRGRAMGSTGQGYNLARFDARLLKGSRVPDTSGIVSL
jgi:hypothetical protein